EQQALLYDPQHVVAPLPVFGAAAKATGHTNTPPDEDGVVRRIPLFVRAPDNTSVPAFAVQVFKLASPDSTHLTAAPTDNFQRLMVNFDGAPAHVFPIVSAVDVLRGHVDANILRGKTVFVGSTASDLHDEQLVPTSNGLPMPGVEIHASLYDTLTNAN